MIEQEKNESVRDIELLYSKERSELILSVNEHGIKQLQIILDDLLGRGMGAHWHIDDYNGMLGGDIKHFIVLRGESDD